MCEFVSNKDVRGDVLVTKDSQQTNTEFVLVGVFQVDPRNFFMTSNGKWNQNNQFATRFDQVKPSCHLLPVERDLAFRYSADNFSTVIGNIRAIESLANPQKAREHVTSVIMDNLNPVTIKVNHHLFIVRFHVSAVDEF